jgi:hypothetical protein
MAVSLQDASDVVPTQTIIIFLQKCGVPWPMVSETDVMTFAQLIQSFSQAVSTTHDNATNAVTAIAQSYQSAGTQAMVSGWNSLTTTQVNIITGACTVLYDALVVCAEYIKAQKLYAISVLAVMAGEIIADQFLAVESFGGSELLALGTVALGRVFMRSMIESLEAYIIGKVVEAAAQPLLSKLATVMAGLDWSKSGATAGPPQQVQLDQTAVTQQTQILQGLATSFSSQVSSLTSQMQQLQFVGTFTLGF